MKRAKQTISWLLFHRFLQQRLNFADIVCELSSDRWSIGGGGTRFCDIRR